MANVAAAGADLVKPPANWNFHDKKVADGFDDHVRNQLPWYDIASDAVALAVKQYLPEAGVVYDLGASNGNIARRIRNTVDARSAAYVGIDNSEAMIGNVAFDGDTLNFLWVCEDACDYDYDPCDVVVSNLFLMFLPPFKRKKLIGRLMDGLRSGGALIAVERFENEYGECGQFLNRMTTNAKRIAGVSDERIAEKEFSLVGVQRPLRRGELEYHYESFEFFRFGDFRGVIIEKK